MGSAPERMASAPVVLIEGAEYDHLVPGAAHRHHGGHHGFGAAAGDQHLGVRVPRAAGGPAVLVRQGLPQVLGSIGDGVLVGALIGHLGQAVQQGTGRVEVGVALGRG